MNAHPRNTLATQILSSSSMHWASRSPAGVAFKSLVLLPIMGLSFAVVISGCHKRTTGQPQGASDSAVHPAGPLTLSVQLLHTDSTLADSAHQFGVHDTVHAVIHTENATDTSRVAGVWYFLTRSRKLAENQSDLSAGANDTHFDLINANAWPVGMYALVVDVDHRLRDTVLFPIR
jgi:hypothetical protein